MSIFLDDMVRDSALQYYNDWFDVRNSYEDKSKCFHFLLGLRTGVYGRNVELYDFIDSLISDINSR